MEFARDRRDGTLKINGLDEGSATGGGGASSINVNEPIYVGGIPPEITELASSNLQVFLFNKYRVFHGFSYEDQLRNVFMHKFLVDKFFHE